MTTIVGRFVDSGGVVLASGQLDIVLDAPLVDVATSPDTLFLPVVATFAIANGLPTATIDVVQSATSNVTYRFTLYRLEQTIEYYLPGGVLYTGPWHLHTDGFYYTDSTHTSGSVLLSRLATSVPAAITSFSAIVPNASQVEFTDLLPTGISTDKLPTTVARVAQLLTSDATFVAALRGGPRFRGAYASATYYQLDDCVSYGGSSWIWIAADPGAGKTPSAATSNWWQLIAQKGDPGGTGGNDTAYDATGWDGATDAPSRNAVRDIVEQLVRVASPVLTGNPTAPTQLTSDNSTRIATTAFARSIRALDNSYSRITATRPSGTAAGASIAGVQTRVLNTIEKNNGDIVLLDSNQFTLKPGSYRIMASAPAFQVGRHRLILWNATAGIRARSGQCAHTPTGSGGVSVAWVFDNLTIAVNTIFEIRHYTQTAVAVNGLGVDSVEPSVNEVYTVVEIWRID